MPRFKKQGSWRLQRTLGQNAILDRGMSTLLATVAVLAVLGAYYVYQNSNDAQAQVSQINSLAATIKSMYSNAPTTSDLTTNTIAASGNVPTSWVTGTAAPFGLQSASRNRITIQPWATAGGTNNDGFTISIINLSLSTCVTLVTTTFGSGFQLWQNTAYGYLVKTPPTPTQAQTMCAADPSINLGFR